MKIITFGDIKSTKLLWTLSESLKYCDLENRHEIIFYSLGYDSDFVHEKVTTKRIDMGKIRFKDERDYQFMKPRVLILSIFDFPNEENFVYIDLDVLFGRRFDPEKLVKEHDLKNCKFPLCVKHTLNRFGFNYTQELVQNHYDIVNNDFVFKELIQNCFMLYNRKHLEFLKEWNDLCYSDWYCDKLSISFWNHPSGDESILWYLFMKYKFEKNLGYIYNNKCPDVWINHIENNNNHWVSIENIESSVEDTSQIQFYHYQKNFENNKKILDTILSKNKTSNY